MRLPSFTSALLAAALLVVGDSPPAQAGGLLREVYTDIPGSALDDLIGSGKFPDSPDSTNIVREFEAPTDVLDNYGQRLRGFVLPPVTGDYIFWISSDDQAVLYIGSDTDPSTKVDIASVPGWTSSREWDKYPSQQSGTVRLEASRAYYVEALMKEGRGGDNLAVRWALPGGVIEEPIPETRLLPFGTVFSAPVITLNPVNTTVTEGETSAFSIAVSNPDPVGYQWARGALDVPGATNPVYAFTARMADNGAIYSCLLSNSMGVVRSTNAVLSVLQDLIPPTIAAVQNVGADVVVVTFSEPLEPVAASKASNYAIDGNIVVSSAQLSEDGRAVTLLVSNLTFGQWYTVTVNNLTDIAEARNRIATDSRWSFMAWGFALADVGKPSPAGSMVPRGDGADIVSGGLGIGTYADQLHLSYQRRSGDFDFQTRVQGLDLSDVWAVAGLMARESLRTNSPFAGVFTTPSISGVFFASRVGANASTTSPSLPANHPFTWLRLKRVGSAFSGYVSYDGQAWHRLGSVTNAMPLTVYLGLAVSSQRAGVAVRAEFRNFRESTDGAITDHLPDIEPLGPSSRRTGLVISEIMYHPMDRPDARNLEFVELFNSQPVPERIGGCRLSGSIDYTFPPETVIPAGGFLVVAASPADMQAVYGLTGVWGPFTNNLPNDGGLVRLRDRIGGVLLEVDYGDSVAWPVAADGGGHSLVLARPSLGEGRTAAWAASQQRGGSPGKLDALRPEPLAPVRINEFLAHTDDPVLDFVELYNHSNQEVSLSGAVLTDDPRTNRFIFPQQAKIAARGFVSLTQAELGFALSSSGETLYLLNRDQSRVVDAVRFGAQANGVSSGRYPDGSPGFHELRLASPGWSNDPLLTREVVINEIMYHPISGDNEDEYIELYNRSSAQVSLANWRFITGIDFTFPPNTILGPGGYLVVAKNAARLLTNYAGLTTYNTVGDFQGGLANGGERLTLARPGDPALPYQDFVVVDEVRYGEGGRWGRWADGGGSSLELADARSDNRLPQNWADSDESGKSHWVTVEATDVLDHGTDAFGTSRLQVMLMGEGECLIDDVEVLGPAGGNMVPNYDFESGAEGWRARGTHIASRLETGHGFRGRQSYRLSATGRGGTDANHVFIDLVGELSPGSFATLRAKVRWLRGNPEVLLRIRGNYLEAPGRMLVPVALGTPGAHNTAAKGNVGPAILEVEHSPVLPALGQAVRVTARVHDPDGISVLRLKYRVDPRSDYSAVTMTDQGIAGDEIAMDGVWSALIPAQSTTNLVAFYIQASDNATPSASTTYPETVPTRECLVRWGEPQPRGNLGVYRIWIKQATLQEWEEREPSSNDPLPVTFVYGNSRVVYAAWALYSGSPFHWTSYDSPVGRNCNYVLHFPADDPFLGASDFVLNLPSNMGSDNTAVREQLFYWIASEMGRPFTYRRFCHMYVNGLKRGSIFEDAQQPNRDFLDEWFPDDPGGNLYKIEDWFDYDDNFGWFYNQDATLELFNNVDGSKKTARYRWNWRKRAVRGSTHDFDDLFRLADALNSPDPTWYVREVEALVDVEDWMRAFALRHVVGDWDAYGYRRGKNMYAYKPENGRWKLLDWDVAFAFGLGDGPQHDLFDASHFDGSIDRVTERMYNEPVFRRMYMRALYEAAQGPLVATNATPFLQTKQQSLLANHLQPTSFNSILTWIGNRRTYILQLLATNSPPLAITSNNGRDFEVRGQNLLTLEGTAPVSIKTLRLNGITYPITWRSPTDWLMQVPLKSGTNRLTLVGYDRFEKPIPGSWANMQVAYAGSDEAPEDRLVINEIMYHPALPDTGFLELHNTSSSYAFDLSGYRIRGADFRFAEGTFIEPGAYLLVVNNRDAFSAIYGTRLPVAGEFQGRLQNNGETLTLLRPGLTPDGEIVDQVTYSDVGPWPIAADGSGPSLQLVDPAQDNRRPGIWLAVTNDPAAAQGWRFASVTGTANGKELNLYLTSSGEVYVDDIMLVAGTVPEVGSNYIFNGDFEKLDTTGKPQRWVISASDPSTSTALAVKHGGTKSLRIVSAYGGNSFEPSVRQIGVQPTLGEVYTLSFWYRPAETGGGLVVELAFSDIQTAVSIVPTAPALATATPGEVNSVRATVAPIPALWINEIMPFNLSGAADRAGDRDPWIELLNAGPSAVSLDGLHLTDELTNAFKWAFPSGMSIESGARLVVWTDAEPAETTAGEPHASFRPNATNGIVALVRKEGAVARVLDSIAYSQAPANRSFGSFPEGDPATRQWFQFPTPGSSNTNRVEPVQLYINEWMARNTSAIPDPADNDFDDWLELYNPNDYEVDLSGYSLTDELDVPDKWPIPTGTTIPAHGFRLVWADNETRQNSLNLGLHAGFQLNLEGESIGLFGPDGKPVDSVSFGPQQANVSMGRYPDGDPARLLAMTLFTPGEANRLPPQYGPWATGFELQDGLLSIHWSVIAGQVYQAQYKDDLSQTAWQNVGSPVTAVEAALTTSDSVPLTVPQRFYRLIVAPQVLPP